MLTEAQRALAQEMSDISEYCWFARWLIGTEYRLWQFMTDPNDDIVWGNYPIPSDRREQLRQLSDAVGGWIWWREGPSIPLEEQGMSFVPLNDWQKVFNGWAQSRRDAKPLPRRYVDFLGVHSRPSNKGADEDR